MPDRSADPLSGLTRDPRGDEDLVQEVALGNLKRALFGSGTRTHVGRYEVRGILGVGGMGIVYRAHDPELDREVAIKVIAATPLPHHAHAARARLLREARALATLVHPNVLPIYDVGDAGSGDTRSPDFYIVTELVAGESLALWLESRERSVVEILRVFAQAARGLAAAHAVGFVHRDFKPSNVLIGDDGRVRVCDFGLVASSGAVDETTLRDDGVAPDLLWDAKLSRTDGVIGTPGYIAPEQFHGDPIGPRADQFAFCVALWGALYRGHPYFDDIGQLDASGRVLRAPPRRADVPHRLHLALERGLAHDPAARWPSMQPLIDELEGRTRARRGLLAGIVGSVVAGAVVVTALLSGATPECDGAQRLDEIWSVEQRASVRAAIAGIASPYASDSAERVVDGLDAFAQVWRPGYAEACAAIVRGGAEADGARVLRRCYERRLDAFAAMVDALRGTDPQTLRDSVAAATSLPTPASCEAPEHGESSRPPDWQPRDAEEERRALEVTRELARAEALLAARRYDGALAAAERALESARGLGDSPYALQARNLAAAAQRDMGLHAEAAAAYEATYFDALAVPMEAEARQAAIGRVATARLQRDLDRGRIWTRHARALLPGEALGSESELERQAGHLEVLAGDVHLGLQMLRRALELAIEAEGTETLEVTGCRALLADALGQVGRIDEAIELHRHVLRSRIALLGRSHPEVAEAHAELARGLLQAGRVEQAKEEIERALAIAEPDGETLALASMLTTLAATHHKLDRNDLARQAWERALAIRLRWLDADHPHVTSIERSLGVLASDEGRPDEAAQLLGHALDAELRRFGPDHHSVANLRFHLAFVHRERGDHERAVETMLESLRALEAARGPDHADVARPLQVLALWVTDPVQARRHAERAVAIVDRTQSDPVLRAYSYASLADALSRDGRELQRADDLHARALATCPTELCRTEVSRERR